MLKYFFQFSLFLLFSATVVRVGNQVLDPILDRRNIRAAILCAAQKYGNQHHWRTADLDDITEVLYQYKLRGLAPKKVVAVWMLESNLNPYATGYNVGSTDHGLGQINSGTLPWLAQEARGKINARGLRRFALMFRKQPSAYNVVANAIMSCEYLFILQNRWGHGYNGVVAYNAGSPVYAQGRFLRYWLAVKSNHEYLLVRLGGKNGLEGRADS